MTAHSKWHKIKITAWPGGGAPPKNAVWVNLPCGCKKNRLTGEVRDDYRGN